MTVLAEIAAERRRQTEHNGMSEGRPRTKESGDKMNAISGNELIIFEKVYTPAALFVPGACDPLLDHIKAEVKKEIIDPSTEAGRDEIKHLSRKVIKTKTAIEAARVELVGSEKKRLAAIDAEGKRLRDELDILAKDIRQPVTDFENREKDRIAGHEAALEEIKASATFIVPDPSAQELEGRIAFLNEQDNRNWEEFSTLAAGVRAETIKTLSAMLDARRKADADRAELERLRQEAAERAQREREEAAAARAKADAESAARQREDNLKAKAAEDLARVEREKAEAQAAVEKAGRDRIEAERKAERDRIAAEEDAKRREAEATERERRRIQAEKDAEAEAARKREANRAHCARVNNEALAALVLTGLSDAAGKAAIKAIALGEIPHITISY